MCFYGITIVLPGWDGLQFCLNHAQHINKKDTKMTPLDVVQEPLV